MDEINFKDIRVLPAALDLKSNVKKNLAEILSQLQTGSLLRASIIGKNAKGEAIIQTSYGRFIAPNNQNLQTGDTITIRVNNSNNQLSGAIVTVNNQNLPKGEIASIEHLKPEANISNIRSQSQSATNVDLINSAKIPQIINGQISYLNLSKITQDSILYKELININPQKELANITLKLGLSPENITTGFLVKAEVKEGTNQKQFLRTDFGIITVKESKMPVGKELMLEITSLNNKPVINNVSNNVTTLVLNIAKNLPALQNLLNASNIKETPALLQGDKNHRSEQSLGRTDTWNNNKTPVRTILGVLPSIENNSNKNLIPQAASTSPNGQIPLANPSIPPNSRSLPSDTDIENFALNNARNNSLVKPENKLVWQENQGVVRKNEDRFSLNKAIKELSVSTEEIKKITQEYSQVKELLIPNVKSEEANQKWQTVFIPFWNGQNVEEKEIQIKRSRENYLRFIFNITLEGEGILQLDGLVKFRDGSKIPVNFDMVFRSNQKLSAELQEKISDIFVTGQKISGINGQMHFEETEDF